MRIPQVEKICLVLCWSLSLFALSNGFGTNPLPTRTGMMQDSLIRRPTSLQGMKRPILDQLASFVFNLEQDRVENSSVLDDKGRVGEPMEWSEGNSLANKFSEMIAGNKIGYVFKQSVADLIAGDFDEEEVTSQIDSFVQQNPIAMFSFTTCPFCRRAKDYMDQEGIPYATIELDTLEGNRGNEIRAVLGRKTGRTSVPSIFIGENYVGGCNDGPGLLPLAETGELKVLVDQVLSA